MSSAVHAPIVRDRDPLRPSMPPLQTKRQSSQHYKSRHNTARSIDSDTDDIKSDNSNHGRRSSYFQRRPSPHSPTSILLDDPTIPVSLQPRSRSVATKNAHQVPVAIVQRHAANNTDTLIDVEDTPSKSTILPNVDSHCPSFRSFPFTSTKEPFRDVSGFFTLHRTALLAFVTVVFVFLLHLRSLLFPTSGKPSPLASEWWAQPIWSILLILPIMHYAISFFGAMLFYFDTKLDDTQPLSTPVVWRIVSRGFNTECLLETISRCREEMRQNPLFPFLIEIVTDGNTFEAPDASDVVHLKVPPTYKSPHGTLFKARALHYASQYSVIPDDAWVVHLDEETRPTSSGIKGIASFIGECERKSDYKRIGQGIMLYHRSWRQHPLLTLADMARTGEDIGSFYLQNVIGYPFVGLHGAYVVCRQNEERALGFDVGPDGSITEDCWWVFCAAQKGFRLRWVHGYLEEQSTESLMDFLKQRRRWMVGLVKVMCLHPTNLSVRGMFVLLMTKWIFSPFILPFQLGYIVLIVMNRIDVPYFITLLSFFNIAMVFYPYLVGWYVNLREGMDVRKRNVPSWTLALIILTPLFQCLELFALILSFFAPWSKSAQGFHVVEKSTTEAQLTSYPSSMSSLPTLPSIESSKLQTHQDNLHNSPSNTVHMV